MFNFKFQLLLICGLFSFLLMICWPTSILACSSRSIIKPRPVAIEATIPTKTVSLSMPKRVPKSSTTTASSTKTIIGSAPATTTTTSSTSTSSTTTSTTTTSTSTSTSTSTTIITTIRPNITFPTFKCPADYDAWYCLNDASCFSVKIGDAVMYNCECSIGFMGPRCEYKELDGSFQPKRPRPILEKASIASGVACILLFLLFIFLIIYMRYDQKSNQINHHHHHHNYEKRHVTCERCLYCFNNINNNNKQHHIIPSRKEDTTVKHSMLGHIDYPIEAFPMGGFMTKRYHKA